MRRKNEVVYPYVAADWDAVRDGWGHEYWEVGPMDPRRDGVPGVYKNGLDHEGMNKYHGKMISFLLGMFWWVIGCLVGGLIGDAAFQAILSLLNSQFVFHIGVVDYWTAAINVGFFSLCGFGTPYLFFLCYRTQRSLWVTLKFVFWGFLPARFCGGGRRSKIGFSSVGPVIFFD